MTQHYCPACQRGLHLVLQSRIAEHNLDCATTGERQYRAPRYVPARTRVAARIKQGSGAHGKQAFS